MATEGGQALLQRLFIADVRQNLCAPGQGGLAGAGQQQSRSGHQCRQPDAFQRHCLATGVGTGDGHDAQRGRHLHADRDDGWPAGALLLPDQQGVPQILEPERSVGCVQQLRRRSTKPAAVTPPGQSQIQPQQDQHQRAQCGVVLGHGSAELSQHLPFFIPDAHLQRRQPVTDAQNRTGLNKQGAAGRRAVVHLPSDLSHRTRLHRQDGAAVALGDHRVLQTRTQASQQLLKFVPTLLTQPLPLQAKGSEARAGSISDAAALLEGEFEPLLELRQGHHRLDQAGAGRSQLRFIDLTTQAPGGRQGVGHG